MSTSPDVLVEAGSARVTSVQPRELRSGSWTRLGSTTVLGDSVTEHTLAGLVEEAQAAARAQGYSRGWAEGRRAAEEQAAQERAAVLGHQQQAEERREAEHRAAVSGLVAAAARLDEAVTLTCRQVEDQALDLAARLTETLVGHEVAVAADPGLDAVRRGLALAQGEPLLRVRVHPDDRSPELATVTGAAAIIGDPTLGRGDAVLETAEGVIDARVSTAVARVQGLLRS
jgi:flagellar assembly protein FliH